MKQIYLFIFSCFFISSCSNDEAVVPEIESGFLDNTSWKLIEHDTIPKVFSKSEIDFKRDDKGRNVLWFSYSYVVDKVGAQGSSLYKHDYPFIYPCNGYDESLITDIESFVIVSPFQMKATLRSGEVVYYKGKYWPE